MSLDIAALHTELRGVKPANIEESAQTWKARDRATGIEMVLVMQGEFLMGSPNSEADRNADEGHSTGSG